MNTENNKIIAEFMGYRKMHPENKSLYNIVRNHELHIEDFKYDFDWNWLMEVVGKIESLEDTERFEISNCSVNITYWTSKEIKFNCNIHHRNNGKYLMGGEKTVNTKIDAVYNACLEFIKWYLENAANKE